VHKYKVKTKGVSHCDLAIYIQKYLKAKKNYGNSNIPPCKKYLIFKKSSKRNQNPSRLL
jgi:hypothetical protein